MAFDHSYIESEIVGLLSSSETWKHQVFSLIGPPAAGRRTLMRRLEGALSKDFQVFVLDLPSAELDATALALVQLAERLPGFTINQRKLKLEDAFYWLDKAFYKNQGSSRRPVAMVYAPWFRGGSGEEPTVFRRNSGLESVIQKVSAYCSIVMATGHPWPASRKFHLKKFSCSDEWIGTEFPTHQVELSSILAKAPACSGMELRLSYGLLNYEDSSTEVTRSFSDSLPLESLVDRLWRCVEKKSDAETLYAWKFLALAREPIPRTWLRKLDQGLADHSLVNCALTYTYGDRLVMHEQVRAPALKALEKAMEERVSLHRLYSELWSEQHQSRQAAKATVSDLQYVYHAAEAGVDWVELKDKVWFQDQLCLVGRSLSKRHRRFREAYECFRLAREIEPTDAYAWHYEGYNHSRIASPDSSKVTRAYLKAVELDPPQLWYHQRLIRWYLERGQNKEVRRSWANAQNCTSVRSFDPPEDTYRALHWLIIEKALEVGDLDFAGEVLNDIPPHIFENDEDLRSCRERLMILTLAEQDKLLRPVQVARKIGVDELLSEAELLSRRHSNEALLRWYAARVEEVDDRRIYLLMAEGSKASPEFVRSEIDRDTFESYSQDECFDELTRGRFLEIGEYGENRRPVIRVFRMTRQPAFGRGSWNG